MAFVSPVLADRPLVPAVPWTAVLPVPAPGPQAQVQVGQAGAGRAARQCLRMVQANGALVPAVLAQAVQAGR